MLWYCLFNFLKTREEYLSILTYKASSSRLNQFEEKKSFSEHISRQSSPLPSFVDWRLPTGPDGKVLVTKIRQQGICGSCWAHSAVCSLEGQYINVTGERTEFSEQDLMDSNIDNNGCNGGFAFKAFDFIKKRGGIQSRDEYPYIARKVKSNRKK